jgi:hypothetical protein
MNRQMNRETLEQTYRCTIRMMNTQTDEQTGIMMNRHTDKQTD